MVDMEKARLDELAGRVGVLEGRLRAVERGMRWHVPSAIGTEDEFEEGLLVQIRRAYHPLRWRHGGTEARLIFMGRLRVGAGLERLPPW